MVETIAGAGTPELEWRAWLQRWGCPQLPLGDASHAVVTAPHPDDELLGVGGTIALLAAGAADVQILAVTDGEASHPQSTALTGPQLAVRRRSERIAALGRMCLDFVDTPVRYLGVPDGGVTEAEDDLVASLSALLRPESWCLAPWAGDGHPDHEAAGRAARRACEATGARLLGYPVWMWHWAAPGDPRVPWSRACKVPLPAVVRARKAAALACFTSQVQPLGPDPADAPVLPPGTLARFDRAGEVLFR